MTNPQKHIQNKVVFQNPKSGINFIDTFEELKRFTDVFRFSALIYLITPKIN